MSKSPITSFDAIRILRMYMEQKGLRYKEALAELKRDFDIVSAQAPQSIVRVKGLTNDDSYTLEYDPEPDPALSPHRLPEAYNIAVDVGAQGSDRSAWSVISGDGSVLGVHKTREAARSQLDAMLAGEDSDDPAEDISDISREDISREDISRFDLIDI